MNSGEQQEDKSRHEHTKMSEYKVKPAAPQTHPASSSSYPELLPELVIPDKLLPGTHHPFPRFLLILLLGAVLIALF